MKAAQEATKAEKGAKKEKKFLFKLYKKHQFYWCFFMLSVSFALLFCHDELESNF